MNAAEIERMKKEGNHLTPKDGARGHTTCWCGLCHCEKCQYARAAQFLSATDTAKEKP